MIVKFSDWQGASGMRRACVLSGVGVDGYMGGPGCTLHCFSALIIVHLGCVTCVMCTAVALLV